MRSVVRVLTVLGAIFAILNFIIGVGGIPGDWAGWLKWMPAPGVQLGVAVALVLLALFTFLPEELRRRLLGFPAAKTLAELQESNARLERQRDAAEREAQEARRQSDLAESDLRALRDESSRERSPRRVCAALLNEAKLLSGQGGQLSGSMAEQHRLDVERFAEGLPESQHKGALLGALQREKLTTHKPANMVAQISAALKKFEHEASAADWQPVVPAGHELVERVHRSLIEACEDGLAGVNEGTLRRDPAAADWRADFEAFLEEFLRPHAVTSFRERVRRHDHPASAVSSAYGLARGGWIDSLGGMDVKPDGDPPNWKGWRARRRFAGGS